MSLKDFKIGYGLFVWKSDAEKLYNPGDEILFNTTLGRDGEKICNNKDIIVKSDGLYRITWSLSCIEIDGDKHSQHDAIARLLVNGKPLSQSYTFNILSQSPIIEQSHTPPSIDCLRGKHAVRLNKGDAITLQSHPRGFPFKVIQSYGMNVIGAWIEVEKVAP